MENSLTQMMAFLQRLVGLHRQLLELVRAEREALAQADLKSLEKATELKLGVIEGIRQTESERLTKIGVWAVQLKKHPNDFTLQNLILSVEPTDPKIAGQLRTLYQTLSLLIQRIRDQNRDAQALIEKSLFHINEMKSNALKESSPASSTYTSQGQKIGGTGSARESRLIWTEG